MRIGDVRAVVPGLLVATALLAACSSDSSSAPQVAPSSARPTSVVTAVQDQGSSRLRAFAELAERRAAAMPPPSATPTLRPAGEPVLGADASWPQCPKGMGIPERPTQGSPMPLPEAEYAVLGLTNGPGFTENPCLADQVAWVRKRGLMAAAYAVASLPDAGQVAEHGADGPFDAATELGELANAGYQQGLANVATMRRAGLGSPIVWIDVEPVPDFDWGSDTAVNGAVVEGAVRAYADAGYEVGVYSTPHLWERVVGDLALGLPEWRAAGHTSRAEALDRCRPDWSIQGGAPVLGQWVEADRDQNVTCPGIETDLARWFHQY